MTAGCRLTVSCRFTAAELLDAGGTAGSRFTAVDEDVELLDY